MGEREVAAPAAERRKRSSAAPWNSRRGCCPPGWITSACFHPTPLERPVPIALNAASLAAKRAARWGSGSLWRAAVLELAVGEEPRLHALAEALQRLDEPLDLDHVDADAADRHEPPREEVAGVFPSRSGECNHPRAAARPKPARPLFHRDPVRVFAVRSGPSMTYRSTHPFESASGGAAPHRLRAADRAGWSRQVQWPGRARRSTPDRLQTLPASRCRTTPANAVRLLEWCWSGGTRRRTTTSSRTITASASRDSDPAGDAFAGREMTRAQEITAATNLFSQGVTGHTAARQIIFGIDPALNVQNDSRPGKDPTTHKEITTELCAPDLRRPTRLSGARHGARSS